MLVGFFGSAASGKTSIAIKTFLSLKETITPTELITEQARLYIAKYKASNNLAHDAPIVLKDQDQLQIALHQSEVETNMKKASNPKTIIISDSCIFNSLLYVSNDLYYKEDTLHFFKNMLHYYDMLFYCHPIDFKVLPEDSNRIHNLEQLIQVNNRSLDLLAKLKTVNCNTKIYELLGSLSLEERFQETSRYILEKNIEITARRGF